MSLLSTFLFQNVWHFSYFKFVLYLDIMNANVESLDCGKFLQRLFGFLFLLLL